MAKNERSIVSYFYILLAIALILSFINVLIIQSRFGKLKEAQEIIKEQMKPANIELIKILADCDDCFDVENAVKKIKSQNVNIANERTLEFDSPEAERLIDELVITKLPTVVVSGELNRTDKLANFFKSIGNIVDDKVVYTAINAPFYDVVNEKVIGLVKVIDVVDSLCNDCTELNIVDTLKQNSVVISENKKVEFSSKEGQEYVKKFEIQQIPAALISEDVDNYPAVKQAFEETEIEKKNGFYAIHSIVPPYISLKENKVVGIVTLIMLKDEGCDECYDVNVNKIILQRFGINVKPENIYEIDISSKEGKEYIKTYNVNKAPIIILSPDAKYYSGLANAWNNVGSVEKDGWFVMRNPELLGAYKDLEENKVVKPEEV